MPTWRQGIPAISTTTFEWDLQDLHAKLAEMERQAEHASSKAQADIVQKEGKHPKVTSPPG